MEQRQTFMLLMSVPLLAVATWSASCGDRGVNPERATDKRGMAVGANPAPPLTPEEEEHDVEAGRLVAKVQQLLKVGDFAAAHRAAETAIQLTDPGFRSLRVEALVSYFLRSEQYGRAASLYGSNPDVGRNLSINEAIAFVKTNRLAEARKCYRSSQMLVYHRDFLPYLPQSSSAKGVEATVFLLRGIADVDGNQPENAAWALHHALQLMPRNPLALWYYAEALANEGHGREAQPFFQKAIRLDHGVVAVRARTGLARLSAVK